MSHETQPRDQVGKWRARWRHNWLPLNWPAALMKAHYHRRQAERLLEQAGGYRHPLHGGQDELPPAPEPRPAPRAFTGERNRLLDRRAAAHEARRLRREKAALERTSKTDTAPTLRDLSDDDLAGRMADADDRALRRIVRELDRRDREQARKAEVEHRRQRRDAERDRKYDAAVDAGMDPEHAYADIYGVSVEKQRRASAIAALRAAGHQGSNLRELSQSAFREHAELAYYAAESATAGHMLNTAGKRAKVNPRSLFTGPEDRARKYASDDLLKFWQDNGRLTVEDFVASAIGGRGRANATKDFL